MNAQILSLIAPPTNVAVVNSAGNRGGYATSYVPCNLNEVFVVGYTGPTDESPNTGFDDKYVWSNFGPTVDIFAPGRFIVAAGHQHNHYLDPLGTRTNLHGSSFAAPLVTGAAAIELAFDPTLTPAQLETLIKSRATPNIVGNMPDWVAAITTRSLLFIPVFIADGPWCIDPITGQIGPCL